MALVSQARRSLTHNSTHNRALHTQFSSPVARPFITGTSRPCPLTGPHHSPIAAELPRHVLALSLSPPPPIPSTSTPSRRFDIRLAAAPIPHSHTHSLPPARSSDARFPPSSIRTLGFQSSQHSMGSTPCRILRRCITSHHCVTDCADCRLLTADDCSSRRPARRDSGTGWALCVRSCGEWVVVQLARWCGIHVRG